MVGPNKATTSTTTMKHNMKTHGKKDIRCEMLFIIKQQQQQKNQRKKKRRRNYDITFIFMAFHTFPAATANK